MTAHAPQRRRDNPVFILSLASEREKGEEKGKGDSFLLRYILQ